MEDNALYELLGVSRSASDSEIKRNYHKLAKEYHPDKNPAAGDRFKEISYAYEVLSDPKKRQTYDRFGIKGLQEGGQGGGFSSEDIFGHFFGDILGMGGRRGRGRTQGEDTVDTLKVTLEDLYIGKKSTLQLSKNVICEACKGVGGKPGSSVTCKDCHGQGISISFHQIGPNMTRKFQTRCTTCLGQGTCISDKNKCPKCKGKKVLNQTKILEVHVDKGMKNQQKIYFRGEGDQHPDIQPGDVIIILQQNRHNVFERKDDNLFMKHDITLTEALCGFEFIIKQLDGRSLLIKQPPGSVIRPGQVRGVQGEGMPHYKNPFEKGNLYITFNVVFPDSHFATEDQMKQLESILQPRPVFVMPTGDLVEEVNLMEFEVGRHCHGREEAYNADEDEHEMHEHMHGHMPGVECAHQ